MMNKTLTTPYKPILESNEDIKHFEQEITNIPIESPPGGSQGTGNNGVANSQTNGGSQNQNEDIDFEGFSFEAKMTSS
jgi:hypothetical protein